MKLKITFVVTWIVLLFSTPLYPQGITLSIKDSDLGKKLDWEIGTVLFDNGKQIFRIQFERENDRAFRELRILLQRSGVGLEVFEKTSRNIDNIEVFYNRQYHWFKTGSSVLRDVTGDTFLLANVLFQTKQVRLKYQRGRGKEIIDGSLTYSRPLRENALMVGSLSIQPTFTLLVRWYQDERKKYRQIKFGFLFKFGRSDES